MADNKPYVEIEATGVYEGVLYEDMIDTVQKYHKLYCDVTITGFFNPDYKHPLTFVPLWAMSLPLKKGDKVLVKFADNDWSRPYLWRQKPEIDHWHWDQWNFPEKFEHFTTQPSSEKNFSVQKIGEEAFIVKTDSYTLIRQNNAFILLNTSGEIYAQGSKLQAEITGDALVDVKGNSKIYADGDAVIEANGNVELKSNGDVKINAQGSINAIAGGGASLNAGGNVTIDAPVVTINGGHLEVT